MNSYDRLHAAKNLAMVSQALSDRGENGSAFAAALMSRLCTAEFFAEEEPLSAIEESSLELSSDFITASVALSEFTVSLSRRMGSQYRSSTFMRTVEVISLEDVLVTDEADGKAAGNSLVFRQLAQRLADDGMAEEAGRALVGAVRASWYDAHLTKYEEGAHPIVLSVLNELETLIAGSREEMGATELWEALQGLRFIEEPTASALV